MGSDLPAPPSPLDADLRDFPKLLIDIQRLMNSEFNALASRQPMAWMVGHKLWYRAFHQLPAGSLPDDDDQLCHLAELGFDMKSFRKVKAIALRGWYRCSNGRLYHDPLAEAVNEAWKRKLERFWRTECARIRKANERNKTSHPTPTFDAWLAARNSEGGRDNADVSRVTDGGGHARQPHNVTCDIPPMSHEFSLQGEGEGEGEVKNKKGEGARKRGSRLPENWVPGDELIAYGMGLGFTDRQVKDKAERFRLHWHSSASSNAVKLNWDMAFQGWLRDDRDRQPTKPKQTPRGPW